LKQPPNKPNSAAVFIEVQSAESPYCKQCCLQRRNKGQNAMSPHSYGDRTLLHPLWNMAAGQWLHALRVEKAALARGDAVTAARAAEAARCFAAAVDAVADEPPEVVADEPAKAAA
jgi:hypothetical protein